MSDPAASDPVADAGRASVATSPAGRLRGRVFGGGTVVAGASVVVRTPSGVVSSSESAFDGSFDVPAPGDRAVDGAWLIATHRGFGPAVIPLEERGSYGGEGVDLWLDAARVLAVTCLRDDDEVLVSGARVTLCVEALTGIPIVEAATTDSDGIALVSDAPRSPCVLLVESDDSLPITVPVGASFGDRDHVIARLPTGVRVRARVVGADGAPLTATCTFWPVGFPSAEWHRVSGARLERRVTVGSSGALDHAALVPDVPYHLVIEPDGHAPFAHSEAIRGYSGDVLDLGTLRAPTGRTITGRVTGQDGSPVARARVRVHGSLGHWIATFARESAPTGADGVFQFAGVPVTTVRVTTSTDEGTAEAIVPDDVDSVELRLTPHETWSLFARLADARGNPAPHVAVLVRERDAWGQGFRTHLARTDEHGEFRATGLRADEVSLVLIADARWRIVEDESFARGASRREVLVMPARRVSGRVSSAGTLEPIAGATILGRDGSADASTSDHRGAFVLVTDVADARLRISADGFECHEIDLPGDSIDVDIGELSLTPLRLLRVRVRSRAGAPIAGVAIAAELVDAPGALQRATTDGRGEVSLPLTGNGVWRVTTGTGEHALTREIPCEGPGPWTVTIEYAERRSLVALRVHVTAPDGRTVPEGLRVVLAGEAVLMDRTTDAFGVVEFIGVSAGHFSLRADLEGSGLLEARIAVPAGTTTYETTARLASGTYE